MKENIENKTESYRQEIIDTLCELIEIRTENPPGLNYKACVDYLSQKLSAWKIDHKIINIANEKYPRFSIIGNYGMGEKSIHFHGHYDVVPGFAEKQFNPRIEGDRIYGRGSSDMKSGLVAMLFAIRMMKENLPELPIKITFSIVPDEETGSQLGTKYLFDQKILPKNSIGMIMPEPTSGAVWNANKGALTLKITLKGKPAHVALEHQGINPFEHLVEIGNSFLELKQKITGRKTSMQVTPPEANRSTMLIGGESGSGVNFNVVPEAAFFTIDRRVNPEEKLDDARQVLMEIFDHHRNQGKEIEIEILQDGAPSSASQFSPIAQALNQSILDVKGHTPNFELCPGVLETRFFNEHKIPAYAYGPGLLEVSHCKNEYVEINNVLDCVKIYALICSSRKI